MLRCKTPGGFLFVMFDSIIPILEQLCLNVSTIFSPIVGDLEQAKEYQERALAIRLAGQAAL